MRCWALAVALLLSLLPSHAGHAQTAARNVVLITIDGLRWQEFFGGADRAYFKQQKDGKPGPAEQRFWRPTVEARRAALMPFVWSTVAAKGQILGDAARRSSVRLTNGLWFSYPGYNEMLSGAADPRVGSNDKIPNPNVTVFEWLNARPGFQGRIAAFGSWDVLPFIVNAERSHIPVGTGFRPVPAAKTDRERALNELAEDLPPYWNYGTFDAPIVYAAIDCLRTKKPRVLYIMLGEGDEWAHEGRYDLYLDATFRADRFIQRVWTTLQSLPEYAGHTTLIVTTDHGRGDTTKTWTDHGRDVPAAVSTWIAALGPTIAPLGDRESLVATTSQIAATVAAAVGEDFRRGAPKAAAPIPLGK
jgi:hypothetical protein